jgi:hypothetical protein
VNICGTTYLDGASSPGEDGSLAFVTKEIVFAGHKFCPEYLCFASQELNASGMDKIQQRAKDKCTLIASDAPGSSSKRYSDSGASSHFWVSGNGCCVLMREVSF